MNPVSIVLWKWKDPKWPSNYTSEHVNITADSISRNLRVPHRIFCITDDPSGIADWIGIVPLWDDLRKYGGCYLRLRLFHQDMRETFGDRVVSIDLDTVITGDITDIVCRPDSFLIAKDTQPGTPYNGSYFSMSTGSRHHVYEQFAAHPAEIRALGKRLGYCACDQAAIAAILGPGEQTLGGADGLYSFKNEVRRKHNDALPDNARMVFFHGDPKPGVCMDIPWVASNYRRSKRGLIVVGGASCVWDDLNEIPNIDDFDICAVNDIGAKLDRPIRFWATLHPEKIAQWIAQRTGNKDFEVWSHTKYPVFSVNRVIEKYWRSSKGSSGSSGMFGVQVGFELGYDHILLAGVPMQPTPHYFDDKPWDHCDPFRQTWEEHLHLLKGRVFSMSGWTRDALGYKKFEP